MLSTCLCASARVPNLGQCQCLIGCGPGCGQPAVCETGKKHMTRLALVVGRYFQGLIKYLPGVLSPKT